MSSDAVQTLAEPAAAEGGPFAAAAAEGPFGFKPDRNRPIEPHFDGFGRLTPEQARQVLDVRDGRRPRCLIRLATESVLVEHSGLGYCDPSTGQQWGYRVRRVTHDGPPPPPPPARADVSLPPPSPAAVPPPAVHEPPPVDVAPPAALDRVVDPPPPVATVAAVADDEWTAPARSARAAALADPAERAALVRVLVIWFVVALLLAECVTLLAAGR